MRLGLLAACLACLSPGIAQESRQLPIEAPAEVSLPGQLIAFRTIDPAMNRETEQQRWTRLNQSWGQDGYCSDLQQFLLLFNNILPTHLNQRSLDEIGLSIDQTIDVDIDAGQTPISLLARVLPELHLTWSLRGGICVIESTESAEQRPVVRVYDVTRLMVNPVAVKRIPVAQFADFQTLSELIQTNVAPEKWEQLGGLSTLSWTTINERCLMVIATTYETHLTIENLFANMNSLAYRDDGQPARAPGGLPKFGRHSQFVLPNR
jgi:hypothetical protein